ncbi:solute carrier family 22 member 6-A-like [Erpetoichthys calabaricus]|uniref:solute carrier family 22 member 6-A-like n=1 Tax=Erpetoichthys calabaricus TaxID=27687 RepID=UPI0022341953|nr:solute carrier family 22 member 6-A-like [Erpetoichthys calabaricus]
MGFSDLLDSIGGLGRFQFINITLLFFAGVLVGSHQVLQNFTAAVPEHHCKIPNMTIVYHRWNGAWSNLDNQTLLKAFIPHDQNNKPVSCLQFKEPQWHLIFSNSSLTNTTGLKTELCRHGWTYKRQEFTETIVSEWDLVCDMKHLRHTSQTIYMIGVLVGAIILGSLSDKFGRRTLLIWSYLQLAVAGTSTAFSPSYSVYCFLRFLAGFAVSGVLLNSVSLNLEWIPIRSRTIFGAVFTGCFTLAQIVLAGTAFAIQDWRKLQIALSVPIFVPFVYSWWFPESARWLALNKKPDQAIQIIKKVSRINGRAKEGEAITAEVLLMHMQKEIQVSKKAYTVYDLFATPMMRKITVSLMFIWCATSFSYFGLIMDLQKFTLSVCLVQLIFALIEIPCKTVSSLMMMFLGRRFTQKSVLMVPGCLVLVNTFLPNELQTVRTTLAVIAKGLFASCFKCVYMYTSELYPTIIRQTGMGFASTLARVGSMTAPLVMMLEDYFSYLPGLTYGLFPIIAGCFVFFLPETLNVPLPDTIDDVEAQQKKENLNAKTQILPAENLTVAVLSTKL